MKSAVSGPELSEAICGLLQVLGCGKEGELRLAGRTTQGFGQNALRLSAGSGATWVPGPLLALLHEGCWALNIGLAVHHEGRPIRLGALAVAFQFERVMRNHEGVDDGHGSRPVLPEEQLANAHERAMAFLVPTMTIDAGSLQVVLWALARPLDVQTAEAQAQALSLQRRLAEALGGVLPPADQSLLDLTIPVPGFIVREPPYSEMVAVPHLDVSLTYDIASLEEALANNQEPRS